MIKYFRRLIEMNISLTVPRIPLDEIPLFELLWRERTDIYENVCGKGHDVKKGGKLVQMILDPTKTR